MKKARAILVNPQEMIIRYVDIDLYKGKQFDDGVESLRKHLDCTFFESAPSLFSGSATLVAEIDYLNQEQQEYGIFSIPSHIMGQITGNMLIVGVGNEGRLVDIDVALSKVADLVIPPMEVINDLH